LALTPCCSSVESFVPGLIGPGRSSSLGVVFKPGHQTGNKRVEFLVESDDETVPASRFALMAALVGDYEVKWVAGSAASLDANRPGEQRYSVRCRLGTDAGRGSPTEVLGTTALNAEFVGATVERHLSDEIRESTREVRVVLPSSPEPGVHRGELSFRWPDGHTATEPIQWTVVAPLTAAPSGWVIDSPRGEPIQRSVVIRSSNRPFRVLGASGPLAAGSFTASAVEAKSHRLELVLDAGLLPESGAVDIRIATDHPDQPDISLSVLALPATSKELRP